MKHMSFEQAPEDAFAHYQGLQRFVGWTEDDARRVKSVASILRPNFESLVEDFYAAIRQEPNTKKLITGGQEQIARLKTTLLKWLDELVTGNYDKAYVARRWQAGRRHVEIGLRQVYADAAMARLRWGLHDSLEKNWPNDPREMPAVARSLNKLLDLELALIEDAYTTERLVKQRHLVKQESEATFRHLVEAARCMIVILRTDHSVAYFSPYAEQLTGFSAVEVLGQDYFPIFSSEDDQHDLRRELDRIFAGGRPSLGSENSICCRDGQLRAILWNSQRLAEYEGQPAVLTVGHDITELKEVQKQVLQSERLAAIGQTVAGLAHESRNAFQRSQACLEMLALELDDQPDQLDLVARVQRALDHLHHLYEEVRTYAAPINLDREPCDLAHIWRSAWSHLELVRKAHNVELTEILDGVDLSCQADAFALGQVFRNILENAIAACPEEGEIQIRARDISLHESPAIEVRVTDNGGGIQPEAAKRIFEPFFTTKTKGTGLGMAIAERIVHAHGGRIAVSQTSGSGAEVVVALKRS
jgi:two-component system sensor kinase FixL